jgi:hypothetical protein
MMGVRLSTIGNVRLGLDHLGNHALPKEAGDAVAAGNEG